MVLQLQNDAVHYVPVVELDMGHYQHKQWGKTYYPVLEVDEWVSIDGGAGSDGDAEYEKANPETPNEDKAAAIEAASTKPEPRKPAEKKKPAGRARRGAVTKEAAPEPAATDEAETDAVVAEMEGKTADTTAEEKPERPRRRRAG
jgi:hypothetical protein